MEPFSDTSIASEDVLQQSSLLLVDDEPTALKALQLVLGHYSDIRTAADGQQALALIEQRLPDLVLLDDEMPGMSGMNLCKHIKSTPDLAHIPIIFVTANSSNELEAAALEAGAADFLGKPISPIQAPVWNRRWRRAIWARGNGRSRMIRCAGTDRCSRCINASLPRSSRCATT